MKKYIFTFIFVYLIANSLLFPKIALDAAGNGIQTWFYQILPSLLPFTILSGIFIRSKWLDSVTPSKNTIIPIIFILLCGTIFGFPIGAKLSSDFYKQGYIRKSQAEILSVCTNNFSPMYVNGFVIPLLFGIRVIIYPILFLLYIIPVLFGIILLSSANDEIGPKLFSDSALTKKSASRFQLDMQIIDAGIISGFETLIKICGYIVLFSLMTSFAALFMKELSLPIVCILGNLEISNGIQLLSEVPMDNPVKYIIAMQFLTFGGICGLMQSASFLTPAGLSVKKYLIGKIILSGILTLFAVLLLIIFPYQY